MGVAKGRSLKTLLIDLKNWFALKADTVFSVNKTMPVDGDVTIKEVDLAINLSSDKTQQSAGEFIIRTSGGDASIEDGDAFVLKIMGNRVHIGYVAEQLNMQVIPIVRPVPASITATLDKTTFIAYVEEAGTYSVTYDDGWSISPTLYGITVSGTPLDGDNITVAWDGENDPEMTVTAPRFAPPEITATIDRDTFVEYVTQSGTITLTYTTAWSADPEDYGITVENEPIAGDQIVVVYVKEDRGTITHANPSAMKSTGWNLYNHALGYAVVTKYSETYGFRIGGTYSSIAFSATQSGTPETIVPVDGMFSVPSDGFVFVTGGNNTDTYIINSWSDWTEGYVGEFKTYEESTVDLSSVMSNYFPYGLMRVGDVRDEINLNILTAISRIGRMEYTPENLASAKASGRAYEVDTDYIYIVKAVEDTNAIVIDGSYTVNDHGNEFFYGTNVACFLETLYGNNLKNKLERDVLTISQQTLTSAQQTQVRTNIGAGSAADVSANSQAITNLGSRVDNYSLSNGQMKRLDGSDLDSIKTTGRFYAQNNCSNLPISSTPGYLDVYVYLNEYVRQSFRPYNSTRVFERRCDNTWGSWQELVAKSDITNQTVYNGADVATAKNSATIDTSSSYTRAVKKNGWVILKLRISVPSGVAEGTEIATLNSNLKPAYDFPYIWARDQWNESTFGLLSIRSGSGAIQALANAGGKNLVLLITYPTAS